MEIYIRSIKGTKLIADKPYILSISNVLVIANSRDTLTASDQLV